MSIPSLLMKGKLKETRVNGVLVSPSIDVLNEFVPRDYIVKIIREKIGKIGIENRILIIESSTGSGKSTALPTYLYYNFFEALGSRNLVMTEPRVFNAEDVPKNQICPVYTRQNLDKWGEKDYPAMKLGDNIGYSTAALKHAVGKGILFATVQTITQQLITWGEHKFIRAYSIIMIDEAHERSIAIDELVYLMKLLIKKYAHQRECPFLIVTSATFDKVKFTDYLLDDIPSDTSIAGNRYENIIIVEGLTYPIKETYCSDDVDDVVKKAVEFVSKINKEAPTINDAGGVFRDIAIFVPGAPFDTAIAAAIHNLNKRAQEPVFVVPIASRDINENTINKKNLFAPLESLKVDGKKVKRRVIIGTNVMETGITIDTLGFVIDTGWFKSNEFFPTINTISLITKPITQASHLQRRGRVGRKAPGGCYNLFTEKSFNSLIKDNMPEILLNISDTQLLRQIINQSCPDSINKTLAELVLEDRIYWKIPNVYEKGMMDQPSVQSLHNMVNKLFVLGAIDIDCKPTITGMIMRYTPPKISLESMRMILSGYAYNICIMDLINLAALMLSPIRATDPEKFKKFKDKALSVSNISGLADQIIISDDYIEDLFVFYNIDLKNLEDTEYGINYSSLMNMFELKESIVSLFLAVGLNPFVNYMKSIKNKKKIRRKISQLKQCLYEGYKMNMCKWNGTKYQNKMGVTVIPKKTKQIPNLRDVLEFKDLPPTYIICCDMIMKPNYKNIYEIETKKVSVLDGFISPDIDFDI